MSRLRNSTNRTVLAILGLLLLTGGGWLAATAPALRSHLPAWWPRSAPDAVLLDREALARLRDHGWWTPAVLTVLALTLLLLLAWLTTQARGTGPRHLPLGRPGVHLRTRALADVLAARTTALPGVAKARVRIDGGHRQRLRARILVLLEPGAEPAAVLRAVTGDTLEEVRACAAPRSVDADVRFDTRRRTRDRAHPPLG